MAAGGSGPPSPTRFAGNDNPGGEVNCGEVNCDEVVAGGGDKCGIDRGGGGETAADEVGAGGAAARTERNSAS